MMTKSEKREGGSKVASRDVRESRSCWLSVEAAGEAAERLAERF